MYVCWWPCACFSIGCTCRSGIAGSWGVHISASVNIAKQVSKVVVSVCPSSMSVLVAPCPCQHLVVYVFLFLGVSDEYTMASSCNINLCFPDGSGNQMLLHTFIVIWLYSCRMPIQVFCPYFKIGLSFFLINFLYYFLYNFIYSGFKSFGGYMIASPPSPILLVA